MMIAALLVCLTAIVGTGLVAYGESGKGPLARPGGVVTAQGLADESEGRSEAGARSRTEGPESIVGVLHSTLANITVGLVLLHILGVGVASVAHRENLVAAMISGRKRPESEG
jgi:cytochrome b